MSEKSDFNRHVEKLADSAEKMIETLQNNKRGTIKTLFNAAVQMAQHTYHIKKVAKGLDIDTTGKKSYALWSEVVDRLAEDDHPAAPRLKAAKDWNDRFWTRPDVRELDRNEKLTNLPTTVKEIRKRAHNFE